MNLNYHTTARAKIYRLTTKYVRVLLCTTASVNTTNRRAVCAFAFDIAKKTCTFLSGHQQYRERARHGYNFYVGRSWGKSNITYSKKTQRSVQKLLQYTLRLPVAQGNHYESEKLFRRALEISENTFGSEHRKVETELSGLAKCLIHQVKHWRSSTITRAWVLYPLARRAMSPWGCPANILFRAPLISRFRWCYVYTSAQGVLHTLCTHVIYICSGRR